MADDNRSSWMADPDKPPYEPQPPLAKNTQADIVIIGGGFTGVSTAWHLARRHPNARILLLEARQLAHGASGRNGGLMLNWIAGVHSPDPEHARRIYDTTQLGMAIIDEMISTHDLDVPHHHDGTLDVFTSAQRAEEAAAYVEAYNAAGIPLELVAKRDLSAHIELEGAHAAVRDPRSGHLDGVAMLRAMRPVLLSLGVEIYEGTRVTDIGEGRRIEVTTPNAAILSDAIVLATGAYTPQLGYFRHEILPLHSHVIATEPRSPDEWASRGIRSPTAGFADDLDRIAYGCVNTRGELVFGGGSNAAYSFLYGGRPTLRSPPTRGYAAVEQRMRRYLPRADDVAIAHRWSGLLSITLSRICAIGVRGAHRNVFYAHGFSGHGIVMTHLAGRVLADLYDDDDARWRDLPFYEPRLWRFPPEPLKWLGYHAFTLLTGKSPRRAP